MRMSCCVKLINCLGACDAQQEFDVELSSMNPISRVEACSARFFRIDWKSPTILPNRNLNSLVQLILLPNLALFASIRSTMFGENL